MVSAEHTKLTFALYRTGCKVLLISVTKAVFRNEVEMFSFICRCGVCQKLRQAGRNRQNARKPAGEKKLRLIFLIWWITSADLRTFPPTSKEFMPFRETYMAAFKNDIEYSQLVLQTAAVLQSNKFVQVILQTSWGFKSFFYIWLMMKLKDDVCLFPASPGQKEWAGQTTERGQRAVAERAKENGKSPVLTVGFWMLLHTNREGTDLWSWDLTPRNSYFLSWGHPV